MSATRAWAEEWQSWWCESGPVARWLPAGIAIMFPGAHALLGGLRGDHVFMSAAFLAVYYAGPRLRPVGRFLLPLLIMLAVYDAQRHWVEALRAPIRVAEPHARDLAWFGVRTGDGVVTPAAWWQAHTHPVLDVICGTAYLAFVPVFLLTAAWWRFGKKIDWAENVMWAMLWLNLAAYATWLVYPAAPPWYADHYGLGPAVLTAAPEAGGAARFDAFFGVTWFADYYGRNANVFGAIPSLHVGQTFLAVLFAWRLRSLRTLVTGFWVVVAFSSVYLNHHYIVDGLAGMVFAVLAWAVVGGWRRPAPANLSGEPLTIVTAADETYGRCLYQFLLSVERRGLHARNRIVVWNLGLAPVRRGRLVRRFPWITIEALDFETLPPHVRPDQRTYAWKPVVIHRTMEAQGGRLLWLDSAGLIHDDLREFNDSLDRHGVYALEGQATLRERCEPAVLNELKIPPEIHEQSELVACLLGFDCSRPAVRALITEWRSLALNARLCPPRHPGNNCDQTLITFLIRRGVLAGELTLERGDIDISSPSPVRWASSRNKVPAWLPVWADPLARLWYAAYKTADRQVLRYKAARR